MAFFIVDNFTKFIDSWTCVSQRRAPREQISRVPTISENDISILVGANVCFYCVLLMPSSFADVVIVVGLFWGQAFELLDPCKLFRRVWTLFGECPRWPELFRSSTTVVSLAFSKSARSPIFYGARDIRKTNSRFPKRSSLPKVLGIMFRQFSINIV